MVVLITTGWNSFVSLHVGVKQTLSCELLVIGTCHKNVKKTHCDFVSYMVLLPLWGIFHRCAATWSFRHFIFLWKVIYSPSQFLLTFFMPREFILHPVCDKHTVDLSKAKHSSTFINCILSFQTVTLFAHLLFFTLLLFCVPWSCQNEWPSARLQCQVRRQSAHNNAFSLPSFMHTQSHLHHLQQLGKSKY